MLGMDLYHAIEFSVRKRFVSAAIELKHCSQPDETLARLLIELHMPCHTLQLPFNADEPQPLTENPPDRDIQEPGASAVMRPRRAGCTVEQLCGFHG